MNSNNVSSFRDRLHDALLVLPSPRSAPHAFSVEAFVADFDPHDLIGVRSRLPIVTRLTRKVEIGRRLYALYSADLLRPAAPEPVRGAYAAAFCGICLAVAEQVWDYRCLNCALKMLDGILIEPTIENRVMLEPWAEQLIG